MKVVSVNTSKTGEPAGWWYGNPKTARKCDYLVEERAGEVYAVYIFAGVSNRDLNGRFSFKGLTEVTSPMICNRIKEGINLFREQGESNPIRYHEI